jgi:hypothetical protein
LAASRALAKASSIVSACVISSGLRGEVTIFFRVFQSQHQFAIADSVSLAHTQLLVGGMKILRCCTALLDTPTGIIDESETTLLTSGQS